VEDGGVGSNDEEVETICGPGSHFLCTVQD
jgi:hypothetical protein